MLLDRNDLGRVINQVTTATIKLGQCPTCFADSGEPCHSLKSGKPMKGTHKGRPSVAERVRLTAMFAGAIPLNTEPVIRHKISVKPFKLSGYDVWKANCSCTWKGDSYTTQDAAVSQGVRHTRK